MNKNIKTIKTGQNTTGDWINIQKCTVTLKYRVIGQKINYVRGKNVIKWVIVKDDITEQQANDIFDKKIK